MSTVIYRRGFFRPEVEALLHGAAAIAFLAALVLPLAWGYQQRRQADAWRRVACEYRLREAMRLSPFLAFDDAEDACERLARLGLDLDAPPLSLAVGGRRAQKIE